MTSFKIHEIGKKICDPFNPDNLTISTQPVHFNCFEMFTHFESPQYILGRMKGLGTYKKQNSLSHIRTYAKPQLGAYFRRLRSHLMSYFRSRAIRA